MYTPSTDRLQDVRYGEISARLARLPPSRAALVVFMQARGTVRHDGPRGRVIGCYGDVTWMPRLTMSSDNSPARVCPLRPHGGGTPDVRLRDPQRPNAGRQRAGSHDVR